MNATLRLERSDVRCDFLFDRRKFQKLPVGDIKEAKKERKRVHRLADVDISVDSLSGVCFVSFETYIHQQLDPIKWISPKKEKKKSVCHLDAASEYLLNVKVGYQMNSLPYVDSHHVQEME